MAGADLLRGVIAPAKPKPEVPKAPPPRRRTKREVAEHPSDRQPDSQPVPVEDMDADWWNVSCGKCSWTKRDLKTRLLAVARGKEHSEEEHPEEWEIRVQGFKARKR